MTLHYWRCIYFYMIAALPMQLRLPFLTDQIKLKKKRKPEGKRKKALKAPFHLWLLVPSMRTSAVRQGAMSCETQRVVNRTLNEAKTYFSNCE